MRAATSKITSHFFYPLADGLGLEFDLVEHRRSLSGKTVGVRA
jgi:hypothetical protein